MLAMLAATCAGRLRVRQARQLLGQWTYACCYAHGALAVLQEAYQPVVGCSSETQFVALNAQVNDELLALCALAPSLESNLRAPVIPLLLCSDASPTGGGLAALKIPPKLAGELWRRRAVMGGHTRLATPFEAYRLEHGDDAGGVAASGLFEPKGSLPVYFDFLEVCSGPSAPLTRAMAQCGLVTGPATDMKRHPYWNLLRDDLFVWLLEVIRAGRVYYLHDAPPCTTFSVARRPPLRSRLCPYGAPSDAKAQEGNRLFLRCFTLLWRQGRVGRAGSLEHPHGSSCAALPPIVRTWLCRHTLSICEFGTSWRKDTDLYVVNAAAGAHDEAVPRGARPHEA